MTVDMRSDGLDIKLSLFRKTISYVDFDRQLKTVTGHAITTENLNRILHTHQHEKNNFLQIS